MGAVITKKSYSASGHRFLPAVAGIQANFCKNPKCANFGVPETPYRTRRAPGTEPMPGDYSLVATGKGKPALKCGLCKEIIPLRSNLAIAEEVSRLIVYLEGTWWR